MGRRIGVIAGSGEFPFLLLAEAQKMGYSCVVAGIKEEAETGLRNKVDIFEWVDVGDILSFFKKNGVKEAVFAGKIDHRKIFDKEKFNEDSRRLLAQSKDRGAAAVLKTIIDFMDKEGIQIMDPTLFIASSFYLKNKKLPLYYSNEYTFGSPAFYKTTFRNTLLLRFTSAIELGLSVPRLLGVWLCLVY